MFLSWVIGVTDSVAMHQESGTYIAGSYAEELLTDARYPDGAQQLVKDRFRPEARAPRRRLRAPCHRDGSPLGHRAARGATASRCTCSSTLRPPRSSSVLDGSSVPLRAGRWRIRRRLRTTRGRPDCAQAADPGTTDPHWQNIRRCLRPAAHRRTQVIPSGHALFPVPDCTVVAAPGHIPSRSSYSVRNKLPQRLRVIEAAELESSGVVPDAQVLR